MNIQKNVLIFPAGTEIAFEILNALKYSKFVNIYGGTSVDDHSEFVYKNLINGFPYIDEEGFLEYLNLVIDKYEIDCVYPAHDSASVFFSKNKEKIHAQVIVTEYETTRICRSKKETYEYLGEYKFVPKYYEDVEIITEYPVFVKPTVGQGSNGAKKINNKTELIDAIKNDESLVICEYLEGMEYTIDCFTDQNGKLLISQMRNRERIRTGISVRSRKIEDNEEVLKIAQEINSKFKFMGAWFFQIKQNKKGEYKLLEISPRIPGTMGMSRNLGINFPLLTLFVFWGYDVDVIKNKYDIILDRAFYNAYKIEIEYEYIYIDFDDTITYEGKVNPNVMMFLYQAVNKGKKIHLLSKHKGNLYEDMKKLCISGNLFDKITVIDEMDEKSNYITEDKAIFIDDSFAERRKVYEMKGIPVFDVDMIESLVDWKV